MPQRGRNADEASGCDGSDEGAGEDFAVLWQRYRGQLYTLCLSFMRGNHADAEEAFGNASVLALAAFPARGGKLRNPRAWLHRLFHNACIDLYRKQRRQCEIGVGISSSSKPLLWICIAGFVPASCSAHVFSKTSVAART